MKLQGFPSSLNKIYIDIKIIAQTPFEEGEPEDLRLGNYNIKKLNVLCLDPCQIS